MSINIGTPNEQILSPSISSTPQLTINRDATIDLDSSNAFEGPEKLLEVWFAPSPEALPYGTQADGLKSVNADTWKEMLDLVHCKVLSIVESDHVDAYLLSESSMFVFPHKLVLKTCGTTTLLWGLHRMLEIAATDAGFAHHPGSLVKDVASSAAAPYRVFYSRKNFLYPDQQKGPHRSWADEVRFLDRLFLNGSAYMIGKMNGDHWYLYTTRPNMQLTPPQTPDSEDTPSAETQSVILQDQCSENSTTEHTSEVDETLEILMTDLDEENAKQFYLDHASAVAGGQFMENARDARKDAISNLGTIPEQREDFALPAPMIDVPHPSSDVYGGARSEPSNAHSIPSSLGTEEGPLTFPEELTTEGHTLGTVVSEACGLSDIYSKDKYPDARIDAYLFTPCGFSANGVIPVPATEGAQERDGTPADPLSTHYFTVHVTPEPQCSYASFETNVPARTCGRTAAEIVNQVVRIFRPGRFSVTLFEANSMGKNKKAKKGGKAMESIEGYRRVDRIVHDLDGYGLVFRYYERHDWKGGAPRLGEIGY
ncbi:MAG: spermidine resistance protein [Bathelium mastoideum]|nr:MAG: spermidine resistance protein [Bathelium mastoideum]KAI9686755.1 MAG: spermidine resistance protein [Bathelium mastoideum]